MVRASVLVILRDHPRSRGVYLHDRPVARPVVGSSPLARGLPRGTTKPVGGQGIIPARAGFTSGSSRTPRSTTDHPRSRGVYYAGFAMPVMQEGSSPLARGLPVLPRRPRQGPRIIPARAGFTAASTSRPSRPTDHPRSRGVYAAAREAGPGVAGSSPLARGLRRHRAGAGAARRIIPARAGFTAHRSSTPPPPRDHPRSRGVYYAGFAMPVMQEGSSPLARGLRGVHLEAEGGRGIIPARAGFTLLAYIRELAKRDHPRSRGVYVGVAGGWVETVGSSPLARGLRRRGGRLGGDGGIIPARAGFTTPVRAK